MKKAKIGIIGTGNIGTDLLYKALRSSYLEPTLFMGRHEDSKGIQLARSLGIRTSTQSINALMNDPDSCDIVFDATSAKYHYEHAKILKKLNKKVIDMTPARVGKMCIPPINGDDCINEENINMITCGGQASVPIIRAVSDVQPGIRYAEVVATIASVSAGIGTRENIDEFTQTTKDAMVELGHVNNSKAIILLNPAKPPITMHNTIYLQIDRPDMARINQAVRRMVQIVQQYVPGYTLVFGPMIESGRITIMVQVIGAGDYLPSYAGNLDIISCAGIRMAERWVRKNDKTI